MDEGGRQEVVLGGEVAVDGSHGHVGPGGHVAHLDGLVATFEAELHGGVDDPLPTCFLSASQGPGSHSCARPFTLLRVLAEMEHVLLGSIGRAKSDPASDSGSSLKWPCRATQGRAFGQRLGPTDSGRRSSGPSDSGPSDSGRATPAPSPPPTGGSRAPRPGHPHGACSSAPPSSSATTPWRSIKVIDIARQAGTSPATFYQYFENVEQAILVLAEELMEGAGMLAELVDGDWSEAASWATARRVVEGFMDYWEANRAVFRVVELATEEGDLRFQGLRVRALNAVTVTLARVIGRSRRGHRARRATDPMAVAATLISMLAHVAAHRYGFEFWGIRTTAMVDSQARVLHWAVTGRSAPVDLAPAPVTRDVPLDVPAPLAY